MDELTMRSLLEIKVNKDLEKRLDEVSPENNSSELISIFEEDEIYKGDIIWRIPRRKVEKVSESGKSIASSSFKIGSPNHCNNLTLILYPRGKSESCKDFISLYIKFYYEPPENACITGTLSILGEKGETKTFSVRGNCSEPGFDSFVKIVNLKEYFNEDNLIIQCFIKMKVRSVQCDCDGKNFIVKENRNVDSFEESLYKLKPFSDVKLSVGGKEIDAHKALLAASSPVFEELFSNAELSQKVFPLPDMKFSIFEHLLHYLYTRKYPVLNFKCASELYIAASEYKIHDLQNICASYLGTVLTEKNVFVVSELADRCVDHQLKVRCIDFIKKCNTETLAKESVTLFKN